ncbi:uncharacterized protein LOC115295198 [Suricata suricatta]|uniref:uncharacterized protein LOC115295198 n=1 Tax=Suricata suricatta TaxID=37032 RepID=UPI001155C9D1|nr:uncharacterized protein LOC115295198 [Suricata suricatta]
MRVQVRRRCDVKVGCRRYDAAEARGDGVVSPGEASGSGTGERRGSQATPDALTSPGRQNVRPGPRRAEAAVVTCGGPVTQSRGAGTRRAEPAGGGRPQGPGAAAGQHLPSRLQVRECGARSRRSAASLLPPPPAPAPQHDTQYSPEAEAVPRGSCQWKPWSRLSAPGKPSGACGRRRRAGRGAQRSVSQAGDPVAITADLLTSVLKRRSSSCGRLSKSDVHPVLACAPSPTVGRQYARPVGSFNGNLEEGMGEWMGQETQRMRARQEL